MYVPETFHRGLTEDSPYCHSVKFLPLTPAMNATPVEPWEKTDTLTRVHTCRTTCGINDILQENAVNVAFLSALVISPLFSLPLLFVLRHNKPQHAHHL